MIKQTVETMSGDSGLAMEQPLEQLSDIENFGRKLAEGHRQNFMLSHVPSAPHKPGKFSLFTSSGKTTPISFRITQYISVFGVAIDRLRSQVSQSGIVSSAAEWLLDNYYVAVQALREVQQDLPVGFERKLPLLSSGHIRTYDIAREIIRSEKILLDLDRVTQFTLAYQMVLPLSMGELWSIPTMLRLCILECLLYACVRLTELPTDLVESHIRDWDISQTACKDVQIEDHLVVENCIRSLRTIAIHDWKSFFESTSLIEAALVQDPAGIYSGMDFETRDHYRKAIEEIAFTSHRDELDVAHLVLDLSQMVSADKNSGDMPTPPKNLDRGPGWDKFKSPIETHVGYYLIGRGRSELEKMVGYLPSGWKRLIRFIRAHPTPAYLGSIGALGFGLTYVIVLYVIKAGGLNFYGTIPLLALFSILALILNLTIAVNIINWCATQIVHPTRLPRMDFSRGLPEECATMVAIPAILTGTEEVDSLLEQLEQHYLQNPDNQFYFTLLTDLTDAADQHLPGDDELIQLTRQGINRLNKKYSPRVAGTLSQNGGEHDFFFLMHRERQWNPSEGFWMGWERKRGKLHELNRLIMATQDGLTEVDKYYPIREGNFAFLKCIRYVITLDADTILPRDAAQELVATLAHPLNRAVFSSRRVGQSYHERVETGYTILQPRTDINPVSSGQSIFARIFSGDMGLDLYTRAVSDVYQDLFGEGIYVGKGIYDVRSFERSLDGRIPENALLSHDLFEGIHGRAGLVTSIALIENFPVKYLEHVRRLRRWIRGDWQLLPWLISPHLSTISQWKILDNLRRSLVAPALLIWMVLGWLVLPGPSWIWTVSGALFLTVPILNGLLSALRSRLSGQPIGSSKAIIRDSFYRWFLALTFLPYEAWIGADAILTTLLRLAITHRGMLRWTTSSQVSRLLGNSDAWTTWRQMAISTLFSLDLAGIIGIFRNQAIVFATPLLVVWFFSPGIAAWIGKPRRKRDEKLAPSQTRELHRLARKTWIFFEQFTGPEDHWLPPDHYQESPLGIVAHHTSPTNIGLALLSTLGAYDLGYLEMMNLVVRLQSSLDSMDKLERYRGHLLNWYDTRSLEPLNPRYVSTVDSGNLAACLLTLREGCLEIPDRLVLRWETFEGLLDTIDMLDDVISGLDSLSLRPFVSVLRNNFSEITREIWSSKETPERWVGLLLGLNGTAHSQHDIKSWTEVNDSIANLVTQHTKLINAGTLHLLGIYNQSVQHQLDNILRYISALFPWQITFRELPALFMGENLPTNIGKVWHELKEILTTRMSLVEIQTACRDGSLVLGRLSDLLGNQDGADQVAVMDWIREQEKIFDTAALNAKTLLLGFEDIANRCLTLYQEMDFNFLFDPRRKVFHIGYNVTTGSLDANYYDLLASEARLASLIAISKGDVPKSHWLYMSRPFARINGRQALISWSATMFEYLMPNLFVENLPGTMWYQTTESVIDCQIDYGREKMIPWGISESGYYRFDQNQNYQYRAFGVPGLGFKRGLDDFLVVTPYASVLALKWRPRSVYKNLAKLKRLGMLSTYGFYEAIDFTKSHLPNNQKTAPVLSYMAHHQGMILLSLVNYFQTNTMVRRFHCDPRIKSVAMMLMERIPTDAPLEVSSADGFAGSHRSRSIATTVPWQVDPLAPHLRVHALSNGRFTTLVSAAGSGYSTWEGISLTRWRSDPTIGNWGSWIYVQDRENHAFWSVSLLPTMSQGDEHETFFDSHVAEYRRRDSDLSQTLQVFIAPDSDVEIRLVTLTNHGDKLRHLSLVSYGEVVLSAQRDDLRHPAFNKLFIENEKLGKGNGLLFHRRPRSVSEYSIYLAHVVICDSGSLTSLFQGTHPPRLGTNRRDFLGRGRTTRNPAILGTGLSDLRGASTDPIFSIRQDVDLVAHSSVRIAFLTAAAHSADNCQLILGRYETLATIQATLQRARALAEVEMTEMAITSNHIRNFQTLLSSLILPSPILRSPADRLASNQKGQPELWQFAISGDYPILLVKIINDDEELSLARDILQAHKFWRKRKLEIDLVFLIDLEGGYQQAINTQLSSLISYTENTGWLNRRGGIFTIYANQIDEKDRILLESAARVVLDGSQGDLAAHIQHIPDLDLKPPRLPPLLPLLPGLDSEPTQPLIRPDTLKYDNQIGGFSPGGEEYCIYLSPGQATPAPWINVIANAQFGFLTSESGLGVTWAENSSENRLSTWENDPVSDQPGEALYLRDEETGIVWSPTPGPAPAPAPYLVRHGAGYTTFEHQSHGLSQRTKVFSPPDDPLKLIHLCLENKWSRVRRLTITYYVEWALGVDRDNTQQYVIPEFNSESQVLMARNPFNGDFPDRVAFVAASQPLHGLTSDRTEFLGRLGSITQPAALTRIGLEGKVQAGIDPCAVLQLHVDLGPGEWKEVHFLFGQVEDRDAVMDMVNRYKDPQQVERSWELNRHRWDELLGAVQVQTPEPSIDLLLNRWLLYQTIACRIWGRTALYQSSGAYGFRDQLQDVMGLLHTAPGLAREHILRTARHQFEAGDVLHWWHPQKGRGVRTRFSDDLLWLPYVTAEYVAITGDETILTEKVPFRRSALLDTGQAERYGVYPETNEYFSLFEHCRRAIEKGATSGPHNLPLMAGGDWNDGMNRVGINGRGESVWLAWFLYDTLHRFADLCLIRGQEEPAAGYRHRATNLAEAIEQSSWDGDWYLRAFYDDGSTLGSSRNLECQIDSIAQSWAVLSGGGNPQRTVKAMRAVFERLVNLHESLVMLFTPPFDTSPQDPGYIKGYRPGLRENGGQYTHAAIWVAWAALELGWIEPGINVFQALNPIKHADTHRKAIHYRVEPYVVAADIYSAPPFTGQGGWTWYTGSSSWMYRLGLEKILGLKKHGSSLELLPHIPHDWVGYKLIYHYGAAIYHIQVDNPQHVNQGVLHVYLDGILLPDRIIPLSDESKTHQVTVMMG